MLNYSSFWLHIKCPSMTPTWKPAGAHQSAQGERLCTRQAAEVPIACRFCFWSSNPVCCFFRADTHGGKGCWPQPHWGGDPFPATWGGILAPHFERLAWLLASLAGSVGHHEYSPKTVPAREVASSRAVGWECCLCSLCWEMAAATSSVTAPRSSSLVSAGC